MSTEIATIKNSGSREVDLDVGFYSGGAKGVCIQLTAEMEEGGIGYVQISYQDWRLLRAMVNDVWE